MLLVRLHLTGFFWGDVSLSNTLFRRDAGAFAAYLVDAETGELHDHLSDGQREHDLEIARVNIAGELMDLEAGGLLETGRRARSTISERIIHRYRSLWDELTGTESFEQGERWRVEARIRRLNELGFDVGELVDHHRHRRRDRADPAEGRGRRAPLAPAAAAHRPGRRGEPGPAAAQRPGQLRAPPRSGRATDEEIVAHEWLSQVFEQVVRTVPRKLRTKLEPAEVFHEVLEHRWYLSERAGHDVGLKRRSTTTCRRSCRPSPTRWRCSASTPEAESPVVISSAR